MHDARYRTVFAFPRMVEDLLRGFAAREWADALDFSTLRKMPADYVSDERLSRRGDAVWQVRFHDGRPVLAVLEFQSSDELRRVFAAWMREIAEPFVSPGETLPPEMTLEEIEMTVVERAAEWSKQWIREGIVQGLEHERALLRRMAASRFGTETAERLAEALAGITDPERLAEIGEWLVRCETGGEFLARVAAAETEADRGEI